MPLALASLAAVWMAVTSCATGARTEGARGVGGEAAAGEGATAAALVSVENTAETGSSVSVSLVSGAGARRLLGGVGPRRTETFEVADLDGGTSYRLVAGLTGAGSIVSERFALAPGTRVHWRLPFNTLRVTPRP